MVPRAPSPTPCAGRISASLPRKPAPQTSVKAPLPSLGGSCERGHGGFAYKSPHAETECSATKIFFFCEQHHMLKPRGQVSFWADFHRFDGARIMTQLSDSTWMVIHSMMATLLVLAWVYIPA